MLKSEAKRWRDVKLTCWLLAALKKPGQYCYVHHSSELRVYRGLLRDSKAPKLHSSAQASHTAWGGGMSAVE